MLASELIVLPCLCHLYHTINFQRRSNKSSFNDHIISIKTLSYSCGNYILVKGQGAIEFPANTRAPDGFSEVNKSW